MTYPTPHQPGPAWPGQPPRKRGFWSRLTPWQRVGLLAAVLVLPCLGGVTVIGAHAGDDGGATTGTTADQLADVQPIATTAPAAVPEQTAAADEGAAPPPVASTPSTPAATTGAAVVRKTRTVNSPVPFKTRKVEDDDLAKGKTRVRVEGVPGVKAVTWEITYTDGKPTARRIIRTVLKRKPVAEVIAVGTREAPASRCDPNYSGCVPIASDVDCAGGSGNGPAYVRGPVTVIGDDIYDLDRDGDGVACDN